MKVLFRLLILVWISCLNLTAASLDEGFDNPPESTKPWCYWYWISDNISREGITRDLEAMRRVGIGEALIGNIYLDDAKIGKVKVLSAEWWAMVEHAFSEGSRLGVNIGMFNCPGWSQSGGPWIKPEQAMRFLTSSETHVSGPGLFDELLPVPRHPFQQVAVLAIPRSSLEREYVSALNPAITCDPPSADVSLMVDGNRATKFVFPKSISESGKPFVCSLQLEKPFTARNLTLVPTETDFSLDCELMALSNGVFSSVRKFKVDRSNNGLAVGFIPHAPVSISFPETSSSSFRLVFSSLHGNPGFAEVELSGVPKVERYIEKQLAKMHPTPLPMWDAYLWPSTAEPANRSNVLQSRDVLDLTAEVAAGGRLKWDVPPGDWVVIRVGMSPTGTRNTPTSPEGQGLEVDKMNPDAVNRHFEAYIGKLLKQLNRSQRKAFRHVVADSYEMGSQNWTDGLREIFRDTYGYDPQPWLPVLTGRLVGSGDQSDRFLWDLRRLVADRISYGYVGALRSTCNKNGLKLWLENYGHWGFPGEFLQYGGQSDEVSGEFWSTGDLGSIELRAAASAAHTYGKQIVSAEAFTSVQKFDSTPWSLKKRGDWALTEGVNHWVLHVNIHQPWEDRQPGVNAWFTTEFNRHNTWFEHSSSWIDYYRRCQYMLQQGKHSADVAYFIGEDAPKMTGIQSPKLPPGFNFDYINAEVILTRLSVDKGRFVLPDGMCYQVLVLPPGDTMRPELLRRISQLVAQGVTIVGQPPSRSPSLHNYPHCDKETEAIALELWGPADPSDSFSYRSYGRGHVFQSSSLQEVFASLGILPDVSGADPNRILWTHRTSPEAEIYFLSNQTDQMLSIAPVFRVANRVPELWDPVSAKRTLYPVFTSLAGATRVPLQLEARGSIFVVFREKSDRVNPIQSILHNGSPILPSNDAPVLNVSAGSISGNSFTVSAWAKPATTIDLPAEAESGVELHRLRNDLVTAFHGESRFPGSNCAGVGISVGSNGVAVFEHSANYFAPLLVHPCTIDSWTHIAIAYDAGQPSLYLNGTKVHTGLRSRYNPRPGTEAEPGGNPGFRGQFAKVEHISRALNEQELLASARNKPSPPPENLPLQVSLSRGRFQAEVHAAGIYRFIASDGTTAELFVDEFPAPQDVSGPWLVNFPGNLDGLAPIQLQDLKSLSEHPSPSIKHAVGTAAYRSDLHLPSNLFKTGQTIWLDLGQVHSIAEVSLNNRNLGTLWKPPYQINLTPAAIPGTNLLEVKVVNTWRNRLIGQAAYPAGFPDADHSRKFTPFLTVNLGFRGNDPLDPFGIIGPVRVTVRQNRTVSWVP